MRDRGNGSGGTARHRSAVYFRLHRPFVHPTWLGLARAEGGQGGGIDRGPGASMGAKPLRKLVWPASRAWGCPRVAAPGSSESLRIAARPLSVQEPPGSGRAPRAQAGLVNCDGRHQSQGRDTVLRRRPNQRSGYRMTLTSQGPFVDLLAIHTTPRAGFEPATNRLTADRSTTELPRNDRSRGLEEPTFRRRRWARGAVPAAAPPQSARDPLDRPPCGRRHRRPPVPPAGG
jgi:hypothetical protein